MQESKSVRTLIRSRSARSMLAAIATITVVLSGCTKKKDETATLNIRLPAEKGSYCAEEVASAKYQTLTTQSSEWSFPDPETIGDIKCYGVAVEVPEMINGFICTDVNDVTVMKPNLLIGPMPAGANVTVDVPSGQQRKVILVGFAADKIEDCFPKAPDATGSGGGPDQTKLSAPRILGSQKADLIPGDNEMTIVASLASSQKFETCSNWASAGPMPSPSPNPSASPSPSPTPGPTPTVNFVMASQSVSESGVSATAVVSLTNTSMYPITVPYTVSGTATLSDHDLMDSFIVIAPYTSTGVITFNIVDDAMVEGAETIIITLGNPTNAFLGGLAMHTVTINDDDVAMVSYSLSALTLSQGAASAGVPTTVTLTALDSMGNPYLGAITVTFGHVGGGSTVSIGGVTDLGGGVYQATFSGLLAGTATMITGYINATPITTSMPYTVTPAAASPAFSVINVSNPTIIAGAASIITLTSVDAYGNVRTVGGDTVAFSQAGGTSTGTIGSVTDMGNGQYTATFTGVTAGTPRTISATINGQVVTTTLPTITVNPGPVSASNSIVTVSNATVEVGSQITATVTARDAYSNNLTVGGSTVTFGQSGGTGAGTFSGTTDVGNGTYTAQFTATLPGTPITITAMIDAAPIVSGLPTVTVNPVMLAIVPTYPVNGSNWNDYVKYDNSPSGTNIYNQDDVACTGAETGYANELGGCLHGGEARKVIVYNQPTCTNLTITDSLSAFIWKCDDTTGTATFYSLGLMPGKGLRDFISGGGTWLTVMVTVNSLGNMIGTSTPMPLWSNPISLLTANAGANTILSSPGMIHYINTDLITLGLLITAPKVSVVTLGASLLKSTGTLANNFSASECYSGAIATAQMICSGNQNYLWIETAIDGSNGTNALLTGLRLYTSKFSHVRNTSVKLMRAASTNAAIEFEVGASSSLISNSAAVGVGSAGGLRIAGNNNIVRGFQAAKNQSPSYSNQTLLYIMAGAAGNRLYDTRLSGLVTTGGTSYGLKIAGNNTIVSGLNISNIGTAGTSSALALSGATGTIVTGAVLTGNSNSGIEYLGTVNSAIIAHVTTANNTWNGFYINTGAVNNSLVHNFVSINQDTAIASNAGGSGVGNIFNNIVAANNNAAIAVNLTGAQTVNFSGFLNVGTGGVSCNGGGLSGSCSSPLMTPFTSSIVGKVAVDDPVNGVDVSGTVTYSPADWLGFAHFWRNWGIDSGPPFPDITHQGACSSGICRIWDWRPTLGMPLHDRSFNGSSPNSSFVPGSVCPAEVSGGQTLSALGYTFLKHAVEINFDEIGNNNGLCESGEACTYAPNVGGYQGEGNPFSLAPCTFQNGVVTGVTLYAYPVTGI